MTAFSRQNVRIILHMAVPILFMAGLLFFVFLMLGREKGVPARGQVVIAVPYSEGVEDYETNYYTGWLEEKTGYDIAFVYLDEGYERESLGTILTSGNSSVDAIFLPADQEILSSEEYQDYVRDGYLAAPKDYLVPDSNLRRVAETYPEVDFEKLLGEDGKAYCFPSVNMARSRQNMQILWINIEWLKKLDLTMPRTAEEFERVLEAFRDRDPNGNGAADELPLVSCEAGNSFRSYLYLLNSFTYYDAGHLSWYVEDGSLTAGVEQGAFRDGIAYCASLYKRGLLVGDTFSYTRKQLMELINDPADTVGAFASHSIADVIYTNNPGILAHFVQLAPLGSDRGEMGYAVRTDIFPSIGGLLPANAVHKEAAAEIMDAMLEGEASLIALYGEEGVDWRFSRDGELSTYGTRARVTTIRYFKGERQNKNYACAGPFVAAAEYTDGVTWNGDHSMTEYIDARAVRNYEACYYPDPPGAEEVLRDALRALSPSVRDAVSGYLEREIPRFITGERDAADNGDWEDFIRGYRRLAGTWGR